MYAGMYVCTCSYTFVLVLLFLLLLYVICFFLFFAYLLLRNTHTHIHMWIWVFFASFVSLLWVSSVLSLFIGYLLFWQFLTFEGQSFTSSAAHAAAACRRLLFYVQMYICVFQKALLYVHTHYVHKISPRFYCLVVLVLTSYKVECMNETSMCAC